MKDLPEYELLSAYLDGELSAEERTRAEQLLADSPEARQRLDELRALSSALHAIPVRRVEEDLSQRVLRTAERRMLSESVEPTAVPAASPEAPVATPSVGRQLLRLRTWLWPAVTVAAALLMWFRTPDMIRPPSEPKLAMTRKAEAPAAAEAPSIRARRESAPQDASAPWEMEEAKPAAPAMTGTPVERHSSDMLAKETPAEKKDAAADVAAREPAAPMALKAPPPAAAPPMASDRDREAAAAPASKGAPRTFKAAKAPETLKAEQTPLLVVQCKIAGDVSKQQVFQEILAAERLALADDERMDKSAFDMKGHFKAGRSMASQAAKPAGDDSIEFSATRAEVLALLAKFKARTDLFVSVPNPVELGLFQSNESLGGQSPGLQNGQQSVELLKQQAQAREARQQQALTAEPTYRVRIELQVVSDAATAGQQGRPAKASSPSVPSEAPVAAPAKGSR